LNLSFPTLLSLEKLTNNKFKLVFLKEEDGKQEQDLTGRNANKLDLYVEPTITRTINEEENTIQ
jgi:hypothetical protein